MNPSNGNETKSDIFPWDIFKSDAISFFIIECLSILMTFKIKIFQFYDQSESKKYK